MRNKPNMATLQIKLFDSRVQIVPSVKYPRQVTARAATKSFAHRASARHRMGRQRHTVMPQA